ncbi:hypothetical protein QZH41_013555, partial [Actinostola sp. cb2023]
MIDLNPTRASQIICTGVAIVSIGGTILGLTYVVSFGKYELTSILGKGGPFWAGLPVSCIKKITGFINLVLYKKRKLLQLFLALTTVCLVLGLLVTAAVGMMLKEWRSQGDCRYTFCPFDEVSILLILLVITWVLLSIMALTGILEASIPLVCHNEIRRSELYSVLRVALNLTGIICLKSHRYVPFAPRPHRYRLPETSMVPFARGLTGTVCPRDLTGTICPRPHRYRLPPRPHRYRLPEASPVPFARETSPAPFARDLTGTVCPRDLTGTVCPRPHRHRLPARPHRQRLPARPHRHR